MALKTVGTALLLLIGIGGTLPLSESVTVKQKSGSSVYFSTTRTVANSGPQSTDPFLNALSSINSDIPQDVIDILSQLRYLESSRGGIESGRAIVCRDASGYSFGGDSDLASDSLKSVIPTLVDLLVRSNDPRVLIDTANVLSMINSKAVPMMATPALESLLSYENLNPEPDDTSSREEKKMSQRRRKQH